MDCYSDNDLKKLHAVLLDILIEICRICEILNVRCFTIGGTAIGAYYFNGFVKWDDDIDLGMERNDYNLFIKESPKLISKGFFIQCFETEPNTPFYFTKVRKDGTLFIQKEHKDLPIHHGIFVDIFPFDNVPNNPTIARFHKRIVQYFEGSFLRRQMKQAILEGQQALPTHLSEALASVRFGILRIIPRYYFYWRLHTACAFFNHFKCNYMDVIKSSVDHVSTESIKNLIPIQFEGVNLYAPKYLKEYIKNHYPDLRSADMLESLWISHTPYILSFEK